MFVWVNIGPATSISFFHDSYSVSWLTKVVKNGSTSINTNNCHNIFSYIVDYGYICPVEPYIFFRMNIGPATPISIYHDSDSLSW